MSSETLQELSRKVSDETLEFIERLLFAEYNSALEKKREGFDVNDELIKVEKSMESLTEIRKALEENRSESIEATAESVTEELNN